MQHRRTTALIMVGTIGGMSIPLTAWHLRDPARFWEELIGVTNQLADIPLGWVMAFLVAAGYVAYTFWAVPFVRRTAFEPSMLKLLAIPLAVVTGFFEELVFRKFLMDWLDTAGITWWLQILATALAFGLAHSIWGAFSRDLSIIMPVALSTAGLGAALGCVYLASDRVILPAIIAHTAINLVIEPALLRSSLTGYWRNTSADTHANQKAPATGLTTPNPH
ncbi:CPBP family intramembrane glutamic endopeptidase [uncultured Arthrobacter sp.]|uniref:CPBP family intramembrane glutamic endopeptidase n=1 Tax=uncultured Arthrobacter sp. TaxID=114050 RepID=UPI002621FD2B|nr:CPBP family intramembrane glutamic endopeptidase [uncultured Arthrobacter sp.]